MQEINAKLQKKPYKFAELALKHSECPTALQGGVLGIVPRGKLYPELDAVLFSIKAGEVSEIVESEIGFHLRFVQANTKSGNIIVTKSDTENTSNNERTFAANLSARMVSQFTHSNPRNYP